MYNSVADFLTDWEEESRLTLKIFEALSDEKLDTVPSENVRTLARLSWHITHTLIEMPHKAGLFDTDFAGEDDLPKSVDELLSRFKNFNEQLITAVREKWEGTSLDDEFSIYGQTWTKGRLLQILTRHMIHHRGQLTVIMRLLGIKVPGIYGPAREEWGMFGMDTKE